MTDLLIVIVNFRTPEHVIACLRSLEVEARTVSLKVLVLDNGSQDDSATKIADSIEMNDWSSWCSELCTPNNLGFAGGNNFAVREYWKVAVSTGRVRPPFVLLLNSDTIVHPGCLAYCLEAMQVDSKIGVLSCKLLNGDGSLQIVARRFLSPVRLILSGLGVPWKIPIGFDWAKVEYTRWDLERVRGNPDWIGGAFMLLRTEMLDHVGLLDEDFFFYGEDTEFCFRVWRSGWRILYDPAVSTTHLGGGSSDSTRLPSDSKNRAMWRARYLFINKCYGPPSMWAVWVVDYLVLSIKKFRCRLFGKADLDSRMRLQQIDQDLKSISSALGPL